ncbi:secretin N-terminal domain-containing protein [Engelhardtia mirabilis]
MLTLQNASAAELSMTLRPLVPESLRLTANQRTNSSIVSGPLDQVDQLRALVDRLDREVR